MSASGRDPAGEFRADVHALRRLSDREREVLSLVSQGLSNTAIAHRLWVMERTVESHIARIFTKLDLPDGPDENRRVRSALIYLRGEAA
jgi:DNA-binding NarL/FixJ family response regulator